jgi:chemotaxis protein MotB
MGGSGVTESGFLDAKGGILQMEQKSLLQGAVAMRDALSAAAAGNADLSVVVHDIDIRVTQDGLLIQILDGGEDLLFDLSSAELKPRLKTLLETIAPILGKLKNQIQLHGHTDARPFPAAAGRTNWELSFERANNARRVLETHGLRNGQLSGVIAHGSALLYVEGKPNDPRNRRLAILAVRRGVDDVPAQGIPLAPSTTASAAPPEPLAPLPAAKLPAH